MHVAQQLVELQRRHNREGADGSSLEERSSFGRSTAGIELRAALIRILPRSPFRPSVILFGEILSLNSDPVGEALREIGDPAVPALAYLLEYDGDSMNRWRAARILWNIDSPLSHKVMHHDLQSETDPAIKRFTEGKSHA